MVEEPDALRRVDGVGARANMSVGCAPSMLCTVRYCFDIVAAWVARVVGSLYLEVVTLVVRISCEVLLLARNWSVISSAALSERKQFADSHGSALSDFVRAKEGSLLATRCA